MQRSVSILECSILLALIAAVATVAIPLWASERIVNNEEQAVAALRRIAAAQVDFHSRNGTYGFLRELSGTRSPRNLIVEPACLNLGIPTRGALDIDGYLITVYLPSEDGHGALSHLDVDADGSKEAWIAYAWPDHYGITGRRVLVAVPTDKPGACELFAYDNSVEPFTGRQHRPFAELARTKLGPGTPFREAVGWVTQLRWERIPDPQ
jgi:hypothetical protein